MNEREIPRVEYSEPARPEIDFGLGFNPQDIDKVEVAEVERIPTVIKLSFWEKVEIGYVLVYNTIKNLIIIKENNMSSISNGVTDPKSTTKGFIVGGLAILSAVLMYFGIIVPPEHLEAIALFISSAIAVISIVIGWFAKDKPKEPEN
jgi:hypothetical protein